MLERPWWQTGVIYQIAVPSFADSDGDGKGDLRGIIGKLDYLNDGTPRSLGVDAIWLTPINASPMRDFGYDVSDHLTINPILGTMDDFQELIAACHERGMRVLMDLVLNHTSAEHRWFQESRSSRDNPRRDWYVWRDGKAPGKPPNRWVAMTEGSAWEYDDASGQYFYHAFLPFQPDLNWRNPDVRAEMLGVARFWLEKGVDGFRLDLINFLYEDALFRDNPRRLGGNRPYFWQRHLYDRSCPESLGAVRDLRRLADGYADRMLMGEVCSDEPEDTVAYLGDGADALHLSFYLDFVARPWRARAFRDSVDWLEAHLPSGAWPCYYLDNHDLKRTYTRFGTHNADAKARLVAAMLLTLRGTPIIYYGQEIGMPQSAVPRSRLDDPIGRRYWPLHGGRDGSRTPMQWSPARNAGFTTGDPWLPVDSSYVACNVEAENAEPASLLAWYRQLLRLRAAEPALLSGSYRSLAAAPRGVFAYVREIAGRRVVVVLNFTARTQPLRLTVDGPVDGWTTLLSTHRSTATTLDLASARLHPYEASVLGAVPA